MCGIVGIANSNACAVNTGVLEKMNAAIVHRGPDEAGVYVYQNFGLAMCRLSIIDVAHGHQPMHNADRTTSIVFNGEIYNFRELKKDLELEGALFHTNSDTEVILHLYDRFGADCVNYLRGMFAFAIFDENDKSLFIARDRIGKKPLLYSHRNNGDLIFGSEFRALLQHPDVSKSVDPEAIHHYLSYYCVPAPLTAYREIRKLEPAHWLRWENGEIEIKRYWSPDFSKKLKISRQEAEEETLRVVREATKIRLVSEVPLGAFLSGGVDSSMVVALMAEESSKPVKTFSAGFEEQDFTELKYARQVAKHIGAEHHEFIVKPDVIEILPKLVEHYGEPYADASAMATYCVAREARKHVTVALNGDGGDENFAGYRRYFALLWSEKYNRLPNYLRTNLIEKAAAILPTKEIDPKSRVRYIKRFLKAASLPKAERYFDWVGGMDRQTKRDIYSNGFAENISHLDSASILDMWFARSDALGLGTIDSAMFTDQMTYLPNDLLVKVDIASMAESLEARSPFLDHKVIEFAASLPESVKLKGTEMKYLLKKVASSVVPREVIYREKMGFSVPVSHWFRGPLKTYLQETLLSQKSLTRGLFRPDAIRNLVDQHVSGKQDLTQPLYSLLMLELWFQHFID
jgi:asparagine synthase (glutamine-hydrolysing)